MALDNHAHATEPPLHRPAQDLRIDALAKRWPRPPACKSYAPQRMDERTAIEARRLAKAACLAAEVQVPSEADYARLREVAWALNEREQWATGIEAADRARKPRTAT
jgi:hypothetical protein